MGDRLVPDDRWICSGLRSQHSKSSEIAFLLKSGSPLTCRRQQSPSTRCLAWSTPLMCNLRLFA